jgi:hypothetical protein
MKVRWRRIWVLWTRAYRYISAVRFPGLMGSITYFCRLIGSAAGCCSQERLKSQAICTNPHSRRADAMLSTTGYISVMYTVPVRRFTCLNLCMRSNNHFSRDPFSYHTGRHNDNSTLCSKMSEPDSLLFLSLNSYPGEKADMPTHRPSYSSMPQDSLP